MRTSNFWKALCLSAAMLTAGAMVSCNDKEVDEPTSGKTSITVTADKTAVKAGEDAVVIFTVESTDDWTVTADNDEVTFAPAPTDGVYKKSVKQVAANIPSTVEDESVNFTFKAMGAVLKPTKTVKVEITADGEVYVGDGSMKKPFTVAEAIAKCKELGVDDKGEGIQSTQSYYIKGVVAEVEENFSAQYGNATFYIGETTTATERFYVYRVYYLNNKKWVEGDPTLATGDKVVVYGKIVYYKGNKPETVQGSAYVFEHNGVTSDAPSSGAPEGEIEHAGTAEDPFTVKDAILKAYEVGETATEEVYYIQGKVQAIPFQYGQEQTDGAKSTSATVDMVDDSNAGIFKAYKINYLDNKPWSENDDILHIGDEIIVCGPIVNYYGNTPETVSEMGYLYKIVECTGYVEPEPDPLPADANFVSDAAFVCNSDDSASASYGLGNECTFNGNPATGFKLGTGSKSGSFTSAAVGVEGDCTLELYAASWNNASASLKLTVNGGGSIDGDDTRVLKMGQGVSGNGNYQVVNLTTANYFTFDLKGLTANSTITFETVSGYRAVVAGVHLLGGTAVDPDPGTDPEPEPGPQPGEAGSLENPFTVAQAIAKAKEVGETPTTDKYYIKGKIASLTEQFTANYGNATFVMVDEGSDEVFTAYRVFYKAESQKWTASDELVNVGDVVIVCGQIVNYNGNTPETNQSTGFLVEIVEKAMSLESVSAKTDGTTATFTAKYSNVHNLTIDKAGFKYTFNGVETDVTVDVSAVANDTFTAKAEGLAVGEYTVKAYLNEHVTNAATFRIKDASESAEQFVDVMNQAWTGVTGTIYTDLGTKKGSASEAVYTGLCAGDKGSIQLRSDTKNNYSGVVTTTSGGKVVKISVKWVGDTADARILDVYGKDEAYTSAQDLYDASTQGTKIASFKKGDGDSELELSGDYKFIGFRSNSGAMYIDEVQITWEK